MIRPRGGVDVAMFLALHTELDLDQALDLQEIDEVGRSWRAATDLNAMGPANDG